MKNTKSLWLRLGLVISGTAATVLLMQTQSKLSFLVTGLLSLALMGWLSFRTEFPDMLFRRRCPGLVLAALVLALATVYTEKSHFFTTCYGWMKTLLRVLGLPRQDLCLKMIPWAVALVSLPMVYGCMVCMADFLWQRWRRFWEKTDFPEQMFLLCAMVVFATLIFFTYTCTEAFYGAHLNGYWYNFDLIYSADSGYLVHQDVFRNVGAGQNDLRQPLYGLFSMPFAQVAWLLSRLLFFLDNSYILVLQIIQMGLYLVAAVMIARMLALGGAEKLLFLTLLCVSYPVLIFSLTAEQYLMAVFWLVLMIDAREDKAQGSVGFIAATGSMLTTGILFPVVTWDKKFSVFVKNTVRLCGAFFAVMILSGRLTTFLDVGTYIEGYGYYAGGGVTPVQKLQQFVNFAGSAFLAPESRVDFETYQHVSWQMVQVDSWRPMGIVVLLGAMLGVLLTRKERFSKICGGWMAFSLLLLGIVGWGTIDNGLMLYSLYFGWAYVAMCFRLLDHVLHGVRPLKLLVLAAVVAVVTTINFAALREVLVFAAQFFPALP